MAWGGERRMAESYLRRLADSEPDMAQRAAVELVRTEIASGELERAERLMEEYRAKYPPDPGDPVNLRTCVEDLAWRYSDSDRPEDAAGVIMGEIEYLTWEYPYPSFYLVEELFPLMTETDRLAEMREFVGRCIERSGQSLAEHLARPSPDDSTAEDHDRVTREFEYLAAYFEDLQQRLDLIGRRTPELEILRVFNADSAFTLDRTLGRITVIDFWATWCAPCVTGYGELRGLMSEFGDDDIAVVGITSLQGLYYDIETGEQAGSLEDPIPRARELELTAEYIDKHGMAWPCLVADGPALDSTYHTYGYPTYTVLDGEGIVRFVRMGAGKQRQIQRMIEKLMERD